MCYREQAAFWCGMINIVLWLFAQMPQVYENYKLQQAESLSITFLITWLLGDITNLLGCIYTHQFPTQLYTAYYFLFMDGVVLSQWIYYYYKNKGKSTYKPSGSDEDQETGLLSSPNVSDAGAINSSSSGSINGSTGSSKLKKATALASAGTMIVMLSWTQSAVFTGPGRALLQQLGDGDDECDAVPTLTDTENYVGYVSAWLSGFLYFTARFPQIYHNYQKKSTEGLSLSMFLSATLANIFYSFSIILPESTDWGSNNFYNSTFAYLLGSGGTIFSTLPILYQFFAYRKLNAGLQDSLLDENAQFMPEAALKGTVTATPRKPNGKIASDNAKKDSQGNKYALLDDQEDVMSE